MFKIKEFLYRFGILTIQEPEPQCSNCTICLTAYDDDETAIVHRLPCGHTFHKNCILRWLRCKNVCPNCRRVVDPVPTKPRGRPAVSTYARQLDPDGNAR